LIWILIHYICHRRKMGVHFYTSPKRTASKFLLASKGCFEGTSLTRAVEEGRPPQVDWDLHKAEVLKLTDKNIRACNCWKDFCLGDIFNELFLYLQYTCIQVTIDPFFLTTCFGLYHTITIADDYTKPR